MKTGTIYCTAFPEIEAGASLITARERLARSLTHAYSEWQYAKGKTAWPIARILSWSTWLQRLWYSASDIALDHINGQPRLLLNSVQEQYLFESVIDSAARPPGLLQLPQTAQTARQAWSLLHQWCIPIECFRELAEEMVYLTRVHLLSGSASLHATKDNAAVS